MDISNFIEICRAYPSIWNVSSKEYRNLMTRNKTYNEIACILGRNKRKSVWPYPLPSIYPQTI